jgi:uncharacterized membrane-anchored protein
VGPLGKEARVSVSDGCAFAGVEGTKKFLTLTQNPTNGDERGTVLCTVLRSAVDTSGWFAVFEYDASGYVKDDEKSTLDVDAILASLREGMEAGNKVRRQRGWTALQLVGWERPPFYDPQSNNLTWATRLRDEDGSETINHSVRLLGRGGVMSVDLVVDPMDYQASLAPFSRLVAAHEYNSGFRYAEWREGDKVASYGLTALVAGGAGALAVKSGLLGKLWKVIVAAGVAVLAGIKKLFSRRAHA